LSSESREQAFPIAKRSGDRAGSGLGIGIARIGCVYFETLEFGSERPNGGLF